MCPSPSHVLNGPLEFPALSCKSLYFWSDCVLSIEVSPQQACLGGVDNNFTWGQFFQYLQDHLIRQIVDIHGHLAIPKITIFVVYVSGKNNIML